MPKRSPGYLDLVVAAFNAKPDWLFVPPNWLGLAAFGALGFLNPGFWLVGAALEIGYLQMLAANKRFQQIVSATMADASVGNQRLGELLGRLDPVSRAEHDGLANRCRQILDQLSEHGSVDTAHQRTALDELLWIHLRLLRTRSGMEQLTGSGSTGSPPPLNLRLIRDDIAELEFELKETSSEDVRTSLQSRLEILHQREAAQIEGKERLQYLRAEISRIKDQVEWIGEQSMLASQQQTVAKRIDQVAGSFHETSRWLAENQRVFGEVEDLIDTAPTILQSPETQ